MKKLNIETIKKYFIYALPVVLYFSYYPLIKIGENSAMNFELSLTVIWLFLFSIISIPKVIFFIKENYRKKRISIIISALFPFYSSITILWSPNLVRAILTAGMSWCVWLSVLSIIIFLKKNDKQFIKNNFFKSFFASTIVVCVFCWLQSILDVLGISRENTLLCLGCTSYVFGFPHPNGFAIEPQFMGNLLLAPSFLSLYLFCKEKSTKQKRFFIISSLFVVATLFLTMSRGAIYAFCVGILTLVILELIKTKKKKIFMIIPVIIGSFIFTLCCQGIFSELSKTNDTFMSGVSKVINQMSLGIIDIPYELREEKDNQQDTKDDERKVESQFDGYAEVSTTTRLNLSDLALKAWVQTPTNFIFGTGIGSAGKAMSEVSEGQITEKEIVQNELMEIALEFGFVGIIILIINIILIIKLIRQHKNKNLLFAVMISFAISYMFFSGLPNAIHVFLLPPILYCILGKEN